MQINVLILFSVLVSLCSCKKPFNYNEAEKLIEIMKEDNRIKMLNPFEDKILINGEQTSTIKEKIKTYNKMCLSYFYRPDYLNSINVSQQEFVDFLEQFDKTNAYSVNYENGKAYFVLGSFLEESYGLLYSDKNLNDTDKCDGAGLHIQDVKICWWKKIKPKWYEADGTY